MKILNVAIICATVIIGLLIWKSTKQPVTVVISKASDQEQLPPVNVAAIQTVLKNDNALGMSRDAQVNQINPKNDADVDRMRTLVNDYVDQAQNISTADCPHDFAEAYRRHLGAWSNFAIVLGAHPHIESDTESFMKNFFRGVKFDFQGPERDQNEWNEWGKQYTQAQTDIATSWTDVEALAARYGAQ